jgi:metal-sulfur cluster biosynthetic enzyme
MLAGACFATILQKMQSLSDAKPVHRRFLLPIIDLTNLYIIYHFNLLIQKTRSSTMSELENKVRQEVGKVRDPETGQTFEEMQMIQSVKETEPGAVTVEFVPTSPFCPIAFKLAADLRDAAKTVEGLKKVVVNCRGHAMEEQINEMTNKQ